MDVVLAEKFVNRARRYTHYNINIMNEKGIIIASCNEERIGGFHEIAYQILVGEKDCIEVNEEDHFQGGRIGINMALTVKKNKIGVLGITGKPDEIRDIASVMKMSLETMLEYEEQNKKMYQRQNLRTRFVDSLLYQEGADSEGELTAVSEQLGFCPHLIRIPVLLVLKELCDAYLLLEHIKKGSVLLNQDISIVTRNNNIIIYRSFSSKEYKDYREMITEFVEKIEHCVNEHHISCTYYVGTFQKGYKHYRAGFLHCKWLHQWCANMEEKVYFFHDYVGDYMRSKAPVYELNRIYSSLTEEMDEKSRMSTVELIEALRRNNYNLNLTSRELFVHKNTLIFRFNKIKELYNVNPIQNTADREFLDWLALYLKMNR